LAGFRMLMVFYLKDSRRQVSPVCDRSFLILGS